MVWPDQRLCGRFMASSLRSYGVLGCALAGAGSGWACHEQPNIELLQVSAVSPPEAQFGDVVQVLGDGFALGNPATVSLRGQVFRPGLAPARLEISWPARTDSQRELSVELPRAAQTSICGDAENASHATFRGDVQVAIAARVPGAPPVTGTLHGAVLELYPAVKAPSSEERSLSLGERAQSFYGIELSPAPLGGLLVVQVAPGSRAVRADLRPGDRIMRAGELTVLQPSDLAPEPSRYIELGVARGSSEVELVVESDGFSPRPPAASRATATLLGAICLGVLAWASPLARVVAWATENLVELRLRTERAVSNRTPGSSRVPAFGARLLVGLGGVLGIGVWLGVGAALFSPVLRRTPVDVGLGLLAVMSGSAILLSAIRLLGARGRSGRWSPLLGLRAGWHQFVIAIPAWIALLGVALQTGFRVEDMVRGQGPWPWSWNAFADPGMALSFTALWFSALPRAAVASTPPSNRGAEATPARGFGEGLLGWIYVCSTCGLCAVAFLGGDASDAGARAPFVVLSLVKYTLLVLGLLGLRLTCAQLSSRDWASISARVGLPLALAGLATSQGFRLLVEQGEFWGWIGESFSGIGVGFVLLGALVSVGLVLRELTLRRSFSASLSPWL
jgi:hypothetical protein